ncbi:hypothetical protein DENSPDRAFT_838415 [Dentipellis sp. KUC8613]|nr:hypothetical protein DENSPDRAFT_838415 [Dentipellis sp. KUC8613]
MSRCGEKHYLISMVALWVGNLLYGLYTALFAGSVYVLANQRPKRKYLVTSIILYVLITTSNILAFVQTLLTPTITVNSYSVGGANVLCGLELYRSVQFREATIDALITVTADPVGAISQIIADGLLIYRCYIIWCRKMRVVLPLLVLLLGVTVCNICLMYYDIRSYVIRHTTSPSMSLPQEWYQISHRKMLLHTVGDILMLFTTVIATALTAGQIWWTSRQLKRTFNRGTGYIYRSAITMIVESGAMFSAGLIVQLIVQHSAPEYVVCILSPSR